MSNIDVRFLGKGYSIPSDVITYIGLVDFTNTIRDSLVSSFSRQIRSGVEIMESDSFMLDALNEQTSKYVRKLLEHDIYDKTANDYIKGNKGYSLFLDTKKKIVSQIISIRKEKLEVYRSGVQDAIYKKDASVTGLDFGIISGSFVNHMIYAYMDASEQTKQEQKALKEYNREIATLEESLKVYDKQEAAYLANNAVPAMNTVFTFFAYELLDAFVSDLIKAGKFDKAALNYINLERSNDLLKNLNLANNKHAVLESAFAACPFNINVYMNAMKYDCLDYASFKAAETFKQSDKVLSFLRENLDTSSDPKKHRIDFRVARLLSLYTNVPLREITAYMADTVLKDGYGATIASLTNKNLCRTIIQNAGTEEILRGDRISKEKAAWAVDPIAPPDLWDKLTTQYGHEDLLDRIIALLPDGANVSSKEELDSYLKEELYKAFEEARQSLIPNATAQKQAEREKEAAQIAYEKSLKNRIRKFWKRHNLQIVIGIVVIGLIIWLITGPKTVDSGGGWSHQVHDFNKDCEICDDDNVQPATHRIRNVFFVEGYYCDECWESYGEDFFERLKEE